MEIERYRIIIILGICLAETNGSSLIDFEGKLRLAISFPLVIISYLYIYILAWGNPERGDMTNMRLEFPID